MREIAAIVELAEERDRKECIALNSKADGANRALAQWLLDHPSYPNHIIAKWITDDGRKCSESSIYYLRQWAARGFEGRPYDRKNQPRPDRDQEPERGPLKTNDSFQDDDLEPNPEMEAPAQILTNVLDSIKHAKSVAEAYRKILKSSPFDREAKAQIYNAIQQLIVKWRIVQSTLDKKGQGNGQN